MGTLERYLQVGEKWSLVALSLNRTLLPASGAENRIFENVTQFELERFVYM